MDNIKYSVDRIEGEYIVLQDIDSLEKKIIYKSSIDFEVNESDIITYDGINYYKDDDEKNNRINYLMEKMNKLRIEE